MSAAARSAWSPLADVAGLLTTPLRPSDYLELLNPLWSRRTLRARVVRVRDETADARTLTLRPGRGWRAHRAGQFIQLAVTLDGRRHSRSYSLSSAPGRADGCVDVTVKAAPGGRVSAHLVRALRVGAYLPVSAAQGDFVLPDPVPAKVLFLTAGSGITPVMSMLRAATSPPDVAHLHWAPGAADVIFGAELQALAAHEPGYRLGSILTRAGGDHFNAALLASQCPDWREREVWACGPQPLLDAVTAHWTDAGLGARLHVERFHAPRAVLPPDAAGGRVTFAASARTVEADGATPLLAVAERAGMNPPHGCRMGICHTCDATLVAGCVRDLRTGALLAEPGQRVQPCVCAAAGDVTLDL